MRKVFVLIAACGTMGAAIALSAQNRPYDQVMKEVAPAYASLKTHLDSQAFASAAEDAAKLDRLFKETENFWTPFKTKDALDFAKSAQTASAAIRKSCKNCHDSHHESMPDKSFKIKP